MTSVSSMLISVICRFLIEQLPQELRDALTPEERRRFRAGALAWLTQVVADGGEVFEGRGWSPDAVAAFANGVATQADANKVAAYLTFSQIMTRAGLAEGVVFKDDGAFLMLNSEFVRHFGNASAAALAVLPAGALAKIWTESGSNRFGINESFAFASDLAECMPGLSEFTRIFFGPRS